MASIAGSGAGTSYTQDQQFFVRAAVVLSLAIVAGFVQLVLRGFIDPRDQPFWLHLHAFVMVGWLALFVTQNVLSTRNLALHRKLGWAGLAYAVVLVGYGWFTTYQMFALQRVPEPYDKACAFSQIAAETVMFLCLVVAAVRAHRDPQVHRRLMLAAVVVMGMNPAITRMLPPMISIDAGAGWYVAAIVAPLIAIFMWHDIRVLGRVHRATIWGGLAIFANELLMVAMANSPAVISFAENFPRG